MPLRWIAVLIPCLLAAAPAAAQQSAYQSLDSESLGQTLLNMQMPEMLEVLAEEMRQQGKDSIAVQRLLADTRIAMAARTRDLDLRAKLVQQGADLYRQIIARSPDPSQETDRLKRIEATIAGFEDQFKLIKAEALVGIEPYAERLILLMGAEKDREIILDKTKTTDANLRLLARKLDYVKEDWQQDKVIWIVGGPRIAAFDRELKWSGAIIKLYRATALDSSDPNQSGAKQTLLNEVIQWMEPYVTDQTPWAYLHVGRAYRENKEYDRAAAVLAKAAAPDREPQLRELALFETARNFIEQGALDRAQQAIAGYRTEAMSLYRRSPDAEMIVDLKVALLGNYLYETQARAAKDPAKAAEARLEAEKALLAFMDKHTEPKYQDFLLEIIAQKYRDRQDIDNLGGLILLARARQARTNTADKAKLAEADEMLQAALKRSDPIVQIVRPLLLWERGVVLNLMGKSLESAQSFYTMAKDYPEHRLAPTAAMNACKVYRALARYQQQQGGAVPTLLRKEFVIALELMLDKYSESDPNVAMWNLDLGMQRRELAALETGPARASLLESAAQALDRVPPQSPDYMLARYLSLRTRLGIYQQSATPDDQKAAAAQKLVDAFLAYSADAAKAASSAPAEYKKDLMDWGGDAALEAAVLTAQDLKKLDDALAMLGKFTQDPVWQASSALQGMKEFEIRVLIESPQDKTEQARAKVEAFLKDYPTEAGGVLTLMVRRMSERIRQLAKDPTKTDELDRYRKNFLKFARLLKKTAEDRGFDADRMYAVDQTLADALRQNGQDAESLALWQSCQKADEARRQKLAQDVDRQYSQLISQVNPDLPAKLLELTDQYWKLYSPDGRDASSKTILANQIFQGEEDFLNVRKNDPHNQARLVPLAKELGTRLKLGFEELQKRDKTTLPVDLTNVQGLARTYAAQKNYDQAMKLYSQMVNGLSPASQPELYWSTQLEFSQTRLAAYSGDKDKMGKLAVDVRLLQMSDPKMGGFQAEFTAIASKAESLSK